jgi:hypothetical protein
LRLYRQRRLFALLFRKEQTQLNRGNKGKPRAIAGRKATGLLNN